MSAINMSVAGVRNAVVSYEKTASNVALILRQRHKLTVAQANEAILLSPLKSIFQKDPEMAAHTSNEAWAREVFAYWKQSTNK